MHEPTENKIVLFRSDEGKVYISAIFKDETFRSSQITMGELFNTSTDNIGLHLKNISD